jgi:NAD(P)H-dependent FMN reductase
MKILGISGSLQEDSANLRLLRTAAALAPDGVEFVISDALRHLPHFDPDLEQAEPVPAVTEWRRAVADSDALFIASPEYGHSLPGSLKNAIDWVIGSGEIERKVVAVTASTPHAERGRRGLQALVDTLNAVSATIVGGEPIVRGAGAEEAVRELLGALLGAQQKCAPNGDD